MVIRLHQWWSMFQPTDYIQNPLYILANHFPIHGSVFLKCMYILSTTYRHSYGATNWDAGGLIPCPHDKESPGKILSLKLPLMQPLCVCVCVCDRKKMLKLHRKKCFMKVSVNR